MRWSVVRLIAGKELRDLVRDRRTVLLILVLPAVLYPFFGATGFLFAASLLGQKTAVGVAGGEHLPAAGSGLPALVDGDRFAAGLDAGPEAETNPLAVAPVDGDPDDALRAKRADAVLVVPPGLAADLLADGRRPAVKILTRDGDDKSKLAGRRLAAAVRAWEGKLKEARFERKGLPRDFDQVLKVEDPQTDKPKGKKAADELRDVFGRVFPFLLVMWLVAGAMQPAVDMTAGEKERGTMETLLISPAERGEIVAGKWLAASAFSFASVVWNVLWLTGAGVGAGWLMGSPVLNLPGVAGCVVLGLPLAMFFSAVSLAIGVFAKSTKEGQYYLMPILLVTMPLAFAGMAPGAELTPKNWWVPVTGAMLLQRNLLSVSPDPVPWAYFGPVLGALAGWVALALLFAVWQFRREGVLFRETGGPRPGGGLRRLFRRGRVPAA